MPIVAAVCPNCNGNLEVDNTKDAAICPYCGTPYIVEKAIKNITNNVSTNYYIENAVVSGEETDDTIVSRGLKFIELNEGQSAYNVFRSLADKHPENYKSWLGLCIAEYYTKRTVLESTRSHAIQTAPDDVKDKLGDFKVYSEADIERMIEEQHERVANTDKLVQNKKNLLGWTKQSSDGALAKGITFSVLGVILLALFVCTIAYDMLWLSLLFLAPGVYLLVVGVRKLIFRKSDLEQIKQLIDEIDEIEERGFEEFDRADKKIEEIKGYTTIDYYIDVLRESIDA